MHYSTRILLLPLLLAAFASAGSAQATATPATPETDPLAGWQEFSIEQAGFKIRFPQKPKLTLKEVKIGKFESAAFPEVRTHLANCCIE